MTLPLLPCRLLLYVLPRTGFPVICHLLQCSGLHLVPQSDPLTSDKFGRTFNQQTYLLPHSRVGAMRGTNITCCVTGLKVKSISVTGHPGVEGRPRAWWAGTWPHIVFSSSSSHFYQLPCPSVLPLWVSCPSLPPCQCVCFCLTPGEGLCASVHVRSVCLSLCTSACEYLVLVSVCPWMCVCVCV